MRHGASFSIHHSDTSNKNGSANSSSETTPTPWAPPNSVDLDSGKAFIRPGQGRASRHDAS